TEDVRRVEVQSDLMGMSTGIGPGVLIGVGPASVALRPFRDGRSRHGEAVVSGGAHSAWPAGVAVADRVGCRRAGRVATGARAGQSATRQVASDVAGGDGVGGLAPAQL